MTRNTNVFHYMSAGANVWQLNLEAQNVIWLRMMGMAGIWNTPFDEHWRMVAEKPKALMIAGRDGMMAAMAGKSPDKVVTASVRPLSHATQANRHRLSARGLRKL